MTKMLQPDWEKEYGYAGGFQTALMITIEHADSINLAKLEKEYPEIVLAFRNFSGRSNQL